MGSITGECPRRSTTLYLDEGAVAIASKNSLRRGIGPDLLAPRAQARKLPAFDETAAVGVMNIHRCHKPAEIQLLLATTIRANSASQGGSQKAPPRVNSRLRCAEASSRRLAVLVQLFHFFWACFLPHFWAAFLARIDDHTMVARGARQGPTDPRSRQSRCVERGGLCLLLARPPDLPNMARFLDPANHHWHS